MSGSNFVTTAIVALIIVFTASEITAQTDAQFLNTWANDAKRGLNTRLGEAELTVVSTYCASGCQYYNQTSFLGIWIKMWRRTKPSISLAQTESSVKPDLVSGYCSSGAAQRKLGVTVSVNDMYNQYIGDFYLQPSDCASASPTPVKSTPAVSANAQFLTAWANDLRKVLPVTNGDVTFTAAATYCANGCQFNSSKDFLAVTGKTTRIAKGNISMSQQAQALRPDLLDKYCVTDARVKNIDMTIVLYDMYNTYVGSLFTLSASDCIGSVSATGAASSGAVPTTSASSAVSVEDQYWSAVSGSSRAQDFQDYLNNYPNGKYAAIARLKINQLAGSTTASASGTNSSASTASPANSSVEEQYWNAVSSSNNARDFQSYLNNYPSGKYAAIAQLKINQLGGSTTAPATGTNSSASTASPANSSVEEQYWNAVSSSNNVRDFQSYLNNYPNGKYAALARLKIGQLGGSLPSSGPPAVVNQPVGSAFSNGNATVEQQYWDVIRNSTNPSDFQSYLRDYPNGLFGPIARLKISQLGSASTVMQSGSLSAEDQYWNAVSASQRVQDFQGYLYNYPNGKYVALANLRISQLGGSQLQNNVAVSTVEDQYWNNIRNSQNSQDFQSYLNTYPGGRYVNIARLRISQINTTLPNVNATSAPCGVFKANKQRGADILAKAQFGSINEMKPLRRYWLITESGDLESKKIISDEIQKEYPQLTAALREEDAEFYIIFAMADNSGKNVINTYGTVNNTVTGEFLVFTSTPGVNCLPNIRILFRTAKTQTFSQAGITFNRHPATNASRDFVKELKKAKF